MNIINMNVVVNTETKEEWIELLVWCSKERAMWCYLANSAKGVVAWDRFGKETCIQMTAIGLSHGGADYFVDEGKEIITFKQFKQKYMDKIKTMDNLEVGDILVAEDKWQRKILGICGLIYFVSTFSDFNIAGSFYTIGELKENYTLKQEPTEPKEPKEVTMEDVCEKFGEEVVIKKD